MVERLKDHHISPICVSDLQKLGQSAQSDGEIGNSGHKMPFQTTSERTGLKDDT